MIKLDSVLAATTGALSMLRSSESLEEALPEFLQEIGEKCGLSCTFLQNFSSQKDKGKNYSYKWPRRGTDSGKKAFKSEVPDILDGSLLDRLGKEGYILYQEIPSEGSHSAESFGAEKNVSCLIVPIYAGKELWGVLGLCSGHSSLFFSDTSITLFRNFGVGFGGLIYGMENHRALIESGQKYQRTIENIRDVVFSIDFDFKLIYLNGGWEWLTGYCIGESLGKPIFSFIEHTYKDFFVNELEILIDGVTLEISLDLPLITSGLGIRWVRVAVKRSVGAEQELFGSILDIHQYKVNAEKLRNNQSAFKSLFHTVEDVLYIGDAFTKSYKVISKKISNFGLSEEKFINDPLYSLKIVHTDDRNRVEEFFNEAWRGSNQNLEYRIINEQGMTLWVENRTWMEYDTLGNPYRLHGRLSDITNSKAKELELLESEERFKVISENLPFPLIMCTLDKLEVLYFNEFFLNMIAQTNSPIRKDFNIDDYVFHPDSSISVRDYILGTVEIENLEVLVREEKGDHWYSLSSQKLPYKGKEVVTIILYNIHKRKLAELERIRLEEVLTALDQTQISFSMEAEVRETYSKLLSTLIFFTKSEYGFLGEVLYDENGLPYLISNAISNTDSTADVQHFIERHLEKGFVFKELDNLIGTVLLSGKPLISNNVDNDSSCRANLPKGHPQLKRFVGIPIYKGDRFIGLVGLANKKKIYSQEDIDFIQPFMSSYANLISMVHENRQRIKAESLHRESKNLYKLLSDNVDDIVSLHDLEFKIRYVSPSIERITGLLPQELLGEDFFEKTNFKLEQMVDFENYPKFVIPIKHKISGKIRKIEMIWKPLYNEQGDLYSYLATSRDVTERELSLLKLKETLDKEKELNQLKSRFIAMTSHEFRTPLATIFSSNDLLKMVLSQLNDSEIKNKSLRHVDKINTQLGRLTQMVTDVLLMEQNSDGRLNVNLKTLDLNQVILLTLEENFLFDEEKPCLNLDLPNKPVRIKSDHTWLSYIIKNIVGNALKYSRPLDRIPDLSLRVNGGAVVLTVRDYGIGVPKKEQKFIFDPFYRSTNTNGVKGTGLGLSIVYELVLKLEGKIQFRSKENLGTAITIVFPYESKNPPSRRRAKSE
ncbi:PAS domain S-box protein [Algoriphagus sp. AGSA1]|uniref:PAS domain S-box protein n=1 Tax=Algoriphagus sp. AGSA1 TaxID=2907213 RepID=UPI001F28651C|nr:PAS domain S-box protein [Algoriphagus sp. AGSA1]MCE7053747.1 PAS domain S-box protein [Algoriphagus sp. AGSA1]